MHHWSKEAQGQRDHSRQQNREKKQKKLAVKQHPTVSAKSDTSALSDTAAAHGAAGDDRATMPDLQSTAAAPQSSRDIVSIAAESKSPIPVKGSLVVPVPEVTARPLRLSHAPPQAAIGKVESLPAVETMQMDRSHHAIPLPPLEDSPQRVFSVNVAPSMAAVPALSAPVLHSNVDADGGVVAATMATRFVSVMMRTLGAVELGGAVVRVQAFIPDGAESRRRRLLRSVDRAQAAASSHAPRPGGPLAPAAFVAAPADPHAGLQITVTRFGEVRRRC